MFFLRILKIFKCKQFFLDGRVVVHWSGIVYIQLFLLIFESKHVFTMLIIIFRKCWLFGFSFALFKLGHKKANFTGKFQVVASPSSERSLTSPIISLPHPSIPSRPPLVRHSAATRRSTLLELSIFSDVAVATSLAFGGVARVCQEDLMKMQRCTRALYNPLCVADLCSLFSVKCKSVCCARSVVCKLG